MDAVLELLFVLAHTLVGLDRIKRIVAVGSGRFGFSRDFEQILKPVLGARRDDRLLLALGQWDVLKG